MKKILRFPLVWIFFLFLFGYMIFDISQYNKTFSELENRELAQRPTFTLSSFYNNKFSPKYESYKMCIRDRPCPAEKMIMGYSVILCILSQWRDVRLWKVLFWKNIINIFPSRKYIPKTQKKVTGKT